MKEETQVTLHPARCPDAHSMSGELSDIHLQVFLLRLCDHARCPRMPGLYRAFTATWMPHEYPVSDDLAHTPTAAGILHELPGRFISSIWRPCCQDVCEIALAADMFLHGMLNKMPEKMFTSQESYTV
jgi:hypothetical protein